MLLLLLLLLASTQIKYNGKWCKAKHTRTRQLFKESNPSPKTQTRKRQTKCIANEEEEEEKIRRERMNERKLLPKEEKKVRIRCSGRRSCRKNDYEKRRKKVFQGRYKYVYALRAYCYRLAELRHRRKCVYKYIYAIAKPKEPRAVNDENTHNSENGGVAFNDAHCTYMGPPKICSHAFYIRWGHTETTLSDPKPLGRICCRMVDLYELPFSI